MQLVEQKTEITYSKTIAIRKIHIQSSEPYFELEYMSFWLRFYTFTTKKMKTFELGNGYSAVCERKKTRSAFKHEATLLRFGNQIDSCKICYQNRTREAYEFESVLHKLLRESKMFAEVQVKEMMEIASWRAKKELNEKFWMIAGIAKLWEIFGDSEKEKNDWKTRMLKAGLTGLEMPSDWDSLDESEKTKRLDAVINNL